MGGIQRQTYGGNKGRWGVWGGGVVGRARQHGVGPGRGRWGTVTLTCDADTRRLLVPMKATLVTCSAGWAHTCR